MAEIKPKNRSKKVIDKKAVRSILTLYGVNEIVYFFHLALDRWW